MSNDKCRKNDEIRRAILLRGVPSTVLGVFVKHPIAGQVKTRLAAELGDTCAADIYAAFIADIVIRFRQAADERYLCFSPDAIPSREYFDSLAAGKYGLWPQPEGDLGVRMHSFFEQHIDRDDHRVVVIGSDSPTLPREHIDRAFEGLTQADCVLGPATDGGYYLVGMRGRAWPIFQDIEWSGCRVLEQTVRQVNKADAKLALLPVWYDVDTPADLEMLAGHLGALAVAGSPINVEATSRALAKCCPVTP
jgi:hypothetical protein